MAILDLFPDKFVLWADRQFKRAGVNANETQTFGDLARNWKKNKPLPGVMVSAPKQVSKTIAEGILAGIKIKEEWSMSVWAESLPRSIKVIDQAEGDWSTKSFLFSDGSQIHLKKSNDTGWWDAQVSSSLPQLPVTPKRI